MSPANRVQPDGDGFSGSMVPSHSPEAEQAAIGAILLDGTLSGRAVERLVPEDFYSTSRRWVFEAICDLRRRGTQVDAVTVQDRLEHAGRWSDEMRLQLVADIAATPSAAGFDQYASILVERSMQRKMRRIAQDMGSASAQPDGLASLAEFQHRLEQLAGARTGSESALAFRSVVDLEAAPDAMVPWVCRGLLAEGHLTLFVSKPKGGKSTMTFGLLSALEQERCFLGLQTTRADALYLSEEHAATLRQKAARFGVSRARFLTRGDAYPRRSFGELVSLATAEAHKAGARVLVVDTLTFWAGLPPDAEKDAGAMQAAADHLLRAAATGLAILVIHHTRKMQGDDSDMVRGSSALPAAADFIVTLKPRGRDKPGERLLTVVGRDSECPPELVIRLGHSGYDVLGTAEEAKADSLRDAVLEALPGEPELGLTLDEVRATTQGRKETVRSVLADLVKGGLVEERGKGKRGSPHRYRKAVPGFRSRSRPYSGGPGTETPEDDEQGEDPPEDPAGDTTPDGAPRHSVPGPPIGNGPGTETDWASRLHPVPWLGYSADLWVIWDDLWDRWQERAAILEHDAGLPKEKAERRAWGLIDCEAHGARRGAAAPGRAQSAAPTTPSPPRADAPPGDRESHRKEL